MLTRDGGWAKRSVGVGKKGESNQRMQHFKMDGKLKQQELEDIRRRYN